MKRQLMDAYIVCFGRPSLSRFHKFLAEVGLRGLGVLNWRSEEQSGELSFLRRILPEIDCAPYAVLDVGANEGQFASSVLEGSKHLRVMAIEPHPRTFVRLKSRFLGMEERIDFMNIAAGAEDSKLELYDYAAGEGTGHASLYKKVIEGIHRSDSKAFDVLVRKLDDVISERNEMIVLIKIDVEGYEREVLRGLLGTVATQDVRFIIVEFNEMNVVSRTFVKDLIEMLPNYRPNRILPRGRLLPLEPYHPLFVEIFAYQNLVFIKS